MSLFHAFLLQLTDWGGQLQNTICDICVARKIQDIVFIGLCAIDFSVVKCYSKTNADLTAGTADKV